MKTFAITKEEWVACEHPTQKCPDGRPLLNADKMEELLRTKAVQAMEYASERIGFYKAESSAANELLKNEMATTGKFLESAKDTKKEVIEIFRGMRMTTTTEVAAMMKPLEDLRKFFLGAEHDKEIARLREFVDLCERLEKLKQSGFLDTVADTMLKLS